MARPRTIGLALLLILGLLGMHVLSGSALDHGTHRAMLGAEHASAPDVLDDAGALLPSVAEGDTGAAYGAPAQHRAVGAEPSAGLRGASSQADVSHLLSAPGSLEGTMIACLLALLAGVLLLLFPFRPMLGMRPRPGLVSARPRARRAPRPPSLHVLSISRT
ncbi:MULTISPECIES: hypothetical protein [Bacteria]|uniref:hypothetical protein n=1 Tax=Bacteria TaxID=2 RepID=UPI003C7BCF7A